MRSMLIAAICAAGLAASAQTPESETVTFTREQLNQLETELNAVVMRREAAAFEAGKKAADESCRFKI